MATPPEPQPASEPKPATTGPGATPPTPDASRIPTPDSATAPATRAGATPPTPGPPDTPTPDSATTATPATRAGATPPTPESPATPTPTTPAAAPPIYPLSLRLEGRRVLVVGGGPVALRRVAGLREAGAEIVVVAPRLTPALADLADRGRITAHRRGYQPGDLDGAWLVLACTDQPEVNAAVAADAERQHLWCARADDAAASAAWVPAVGRADAVTVAVNAGRNPRRAAELRDRFVDTIGTVDRSSIEGQAPAAGGQRAPGRVSIVGGGPGDPGLITVTGLRRLREADVVVADRLAPLALLDQLAPGVQVVDAAKVPGGPAMRQDHINHALVEHAGAGRAVVRLKGGDPFVFGRGREEVEACLTAGVPVEVVPGVTSAISVPAAAGIPVTHRGVSQGFCVLAGHVRPGDSRSSVDWVALARSGMTLVLLMSIDHLAEIADTLIAAGLGGGTPGAVVSDGWSRQQRVVTAPLRDLADEVRAAGVTNPAVVVIGDVAGLAASGLGIPGAPLPPEPPSPGGAPSSGAGGAGGMGSPAAEAAPGPSSLLAGGVPASSTTAAGAPVSDPISSATAAAPAADPSSLTTAATGLGPGSISLTTVAAAPVPDPISFATAAAPVPDPTSCATAGAGLGPGPSSSTTAAADAAPEASPYTSAGERPGRRVLVLGGARSGKSATAEGMLAGDGPVDYIATGAAPGSGDAEWDIRVAAHRRRRPPHWRTVETLALAEVLAAPGQAPLLVDCLTTWLARVMDDCGAWDDAEDSVWVLADRIEQVLQAWRHTRRQVIAVSNEIGCGVVPDTASGRRFRDELGQLNARIASGSDEVWLCTAGIARRLR